MLVIREVRPRISLPADVDSNRVDRYASRCGLIEECAHDARSKRREQELDGSRTEIKAPICRPTVAHKQKVPDANLAHPGTVVGGDVGLVPVWRIARFLGSLLLHPLHVA